MLPIIGAGIGAGIGSGSAGGGPGDSASAQFWGAAMGGTLGLVTACLLDGTWLAHNTRVAAAPPSAPLLTPIVRAGGDGLVLGLAGAY